jgi:hypothetical protein
MKSWDKEREIKIWGQLFGATTLCTITLDKTTLSIRCFIATFCESLLAEFLCFLLNVVVLLVSMLSVANQRFIIPSIIVLSVFYYAKCRYVECLGTNFFTFFWNKWNCANLWNENPRRKKENENANARILKRWWKTFSRLLNLTWLPQLIFRIKIFCLFIKILGYFWLFEAAFGHFQRRAILLSGDQKFCVFFSCKVSQTAIKVYFHIWFDNPVLHWILSIILSNHLKWTWV